MYYTRAGVGDIGSQPAAYYENVTAPPSSYNRNILKTHRVKRDPPVHRISQTVYERSMKHRVVDKIYGHHAQVGAFPEAAPQSYNRGILNPPRKYLRYDPKLSYNTRAKRMASFDSYHNIAAVERKIPPKAVFDAIDQMEARGYDIKVVRSLRDKLMRGALNELDEIEQGIYTKLMKDVVDAAVAAAPVVPALPVGVAPVVPAPVVPAPVVPALPVGVAPVVPRLPPALPSTLPAGLRHRRAPPPPTVQTTVQTAKTQPVLSAQRPLPPQATTTMSPPDPILISKVADPDDPSQLKSAWNQEHKNMYDSTDIIGNPGAKKTILAEWRKSPSGKISKGRKSKAQDKFIYSPNKNTKITWDRVEDYVNAGYVINTKTWRLVERKKWDKTTGSRAMASRYKALTGKDISA